MQQNKTAINKVAYYRESKVVQMEVMYMKQLGLSVWLSQDE